MALLHCRDLHQLHVLVYAVSLSLSHIDGGVIEILSSSQSGSESDLYIVGVDGAKGEGVRHLARHDIIVISSDSEAARHGEDGAPL